MSKSIDDRYQVINGVSYKKETPGAVLKILDEAYTNKTRLSIVYGDPKTGRAWNKGENVSGYVGKNFAGLPVLLMSRTSSGGECIMDASILEIRDAKENKVVYKWEMDESLIVEETLVEQASALDDGIVVEEASAIFS